MLAPVGGDPGPLGQEACGGRPHVYNLVEYRTEGQKVTRKGVTKKEQSTWPQPWSPSLQALESTPLSHSPPPAVVAPGSRCGGGSHARLPPPHGICKARAKCTVRQWFQNPLPSRHCPATNPACQLCRQVHGIQPRVAINLLIRTEFSLFLCPLSHLYNSGAGNHVQPDPQIQRRAAHLTYPRSAGPQKA